METRSWATVLATLFAVLACGCRDSTSQQSAPVTASASAATSGGEPVEDVEYPVVLEATQEMREAGAAAMAFSADADARCGNMAMSIDLDRSRPELENGKKGCPRPDGAVETWGSQ